MPLLLIDDLQAVLAAVGRVDAVVFGGGSLLQDSTGFRA